MCKMYAVFLCFSYCLVTFKAAVQYLMTTDFSDIDLNTLGANEISFQELVKVGIASENKNVESLGTSKDKDRGGCAPSRSRFERQMDNITKMLEESTKDMKPVDDRSVGQPIVTSIFGGEIPVKMLTLISIQLFSHCKRNSQYIKKCKYVKLLI